MIRSHLGRRKAKRPLNDVSPLDCDCREGRFLLRRIDEMSRMPEPTKEDSSFKRKLSKREKKQLKKQGRTDTRMMAIQCVPTPEGVAHSLPVAKPCNKQADKYSA